MSENGDGHHDPLPAGLNGDGRGANGQFAKGNRAGKGNPLNRRAQKLRSAYLRAVTPADMRAIVTAIVNAAKSGDVVAAREVCDRVLGRAVQQDLLERIEALEAAQAEAKR